jgi:hypothetical protein
MAITVVVLAACLNRVLLAVLAFDGLVVAAVVISGFFEPKSDPAGEGLKAAYTVFIAVPFVVAGLLAFVPAAPARWAALLVASVLPLAGLYQLASPLLSTLGERREAAGAADFPRAPARQVAAAIVAGDSAAVRRLVAERHVDLATEGRHERTLLIFAAERRPEMIPVLVALGADPNRRTSRGELPLEVALGNVSPGPAELGQMRALRALLDAGTDPNQKTAFDLWLLELAVRSRRPDHVALLLEHGADPTVIGDRGFSMPMHAVFDRQWALAAELLRRGAPATHWGKYGDDLRSVYADARVAIHTEPGELEAIEAFRAAAREARVELPPPARPPNAPPA